MTMRLTIGIDPGITGGIAALVDGVPIEVFDMPVRTVQSGKGKPWKEIDATALTTILRGLRSLHAGAYVSACVERVGARPGDGGTSAFRFGDSAGAIRGVLEALRIPHSRAIPAVWKRHYGLIGTDKDAARELAIRRFPDIADKLARKKDNGRSDALLLALYHDSTQVHGVAA